MSDHNENTEKAPVSADVLDRKRNPVGKIELDARVFDAPVKIHLLHEVVLYQQAKHRSGTACTKTRGEVAYSNKKPWKQKGTGRARSGERGSPLWEGGGVTFGPKPRDYTFKVNKKAKKAALRAALSAKRLEDKLLIVDELKLEAVKTRGLLDWLSDLGVGMNTLVVIPEADSKVELSARNLPKVKVLRAAGINVRDILLYDRLVLTKGAAEKIQEELR